MTVIKLNKITLTDWLCTAHWMSPACWNKGLSNTNWISKGRTGRQQLLQSCKQRSKHLCMHGLRKPQNYAYASYFLLVCFQTCTHAINMLVNQSLYIDTKHLSLQYSYIKMLSRFLPNILISFVLSLTRCYGHQLLGDWNVVLKDTGTMNKDRTEFCDIIHSNQYRSIYKISAVVVPILK